MLNHPERETMTEEVAQAIAAAKAAGEPVTNNPMPTTLEQARGASPEARGGLMIAYTTAYRSESAAIHVSRKSFTGSLLGVGPDGKIVIKDDQAPDDGLGQRALAASTFAYILETIDAFVHVGVGDDARTTNDSLRAHGTRD